MTDNPFASLSPEQRTQAEAIQAEIMKAAEAEVQQIAALLAAKQLPEVLGQTEFQIRDHLHRIGAVSLEAALETKKNGLFRQ